MRISARNPQYWKNKGHTESESITLAKSRMPGTFEYYTIFKKMNKKEAINAVAQFQANRINTLENFIKKYGKSDGINRWNLYRERQAKSNSFEYKQLKYGWTKDQFDDYNQSRAITLKNCIKRWGQELGLKKWKLYCDRQSYTNTKEYFIEKYGKIKGEAKYIRVNKLKSHTLESYIERYDDVEIASIKLNEYWNTWSKSIQTSKIADKFFSELIQNLWESIGINLPIYTSVLGKEWFVRHSDGICFVDFYIPTLKYAIEFNGDYWHANPIIYTEHDEIKYPGLTFSVKDIWNRDAIKRSNLMSSGVIDNLDYIWEYDYRNDSKKIVTNIASKIVKLYENKNN